MISAAAPSTKSQGRKPTEDLYLVLTSQRQQAGQTATNTAAYLRIVSSYERVALRLLRLWHVPNAEMEAEEAVQEWQLAMLEGGFERWDRERSVYAFANQILHRTCIAILKKHLRNRSSPILTDPQSASVDLLSVMIEEENRLELRKSIAQLHPTMRNELELWLVEGFPRSLDPNARRRRSRLLWRAKQKLLELLAEATCDENRAEFRERP